MRGRPPRRAPAREDLLRHRLAWAAAQGCRDAVIGSVPGGPTERDALRCGFRVAYTQLTLQLPTVAG